MAARKKITTTKRKTLKKATKKAAPKTVKKPPTKKPLKKATKKSVKKVTKKKAVKKITQKPAKKVTKKTVKKVARKVVKKAVKKVTKKAEKKTAAKKTKNTADKTPSKIPKLGSKAPAFSAFNQDGKKIALKDFAGKKHVVLYFYPRAMTPGCTVQAAGIRDNTKAFKKAGAVVLGVSPDAAVRLDKFRQRDSLNFDLLSDEDKTVAKAYGVWGLKKFMGREFMGIRRWTFIIGKDGKIKHFMDKVKTKTHHDDVLEILKDL